MARPQVASTNIIKFNILTSSLNVIVIVYIPFHIHPLVIQTFDNAIDLNS